MKKINLWIGLIAIIFTITSCEDMGDLFGGSNKPGDKNLKFTNKPIEQIKQQIESEGIKFIDELMSLQETQLFPVVEYAFELFGDNENQTNEATLRTLTYGLRKSPVQTGFKLHKQMRAETGKMDELWGLYEYDFETNQIVKLQDSYNEITLDFPSSAEQKSNNAKLILGVIDSDLPIDWLEEDKDPFQDPNQQPNQNPNQIKYPERIYLSIRVNEVEIFYADIYAEYFDDGVPKNLRQSLKLEAFKWVTKVENTGRKITETLRLNKGEKRLVFSEAILQGNFSREIIERDFSSDKDYPDELFDSFSGYATIMDIGVGASMTNFKGFYEALRKAKNEKLSPEQAAQLEAEAFNKHISNAYGYFETEKKKFADLEFDTHRYEDGYWDPDREEWVEFTNYSIAPVFVLNDDSRVSPDVFVSQGFDNLLTKAEELIELIGLYVKDNEEYEEEHYH